MKYEIAPGAVWLAGSFTTQEVSRNTHWPVLQRSSLIGNLAAAQWARLLSQDSALVFFNGQINFLNARLFLFFLFFLRKKSDRLANKAIWFKGEKVLSSLVLWKWETEGEENRGAGAANSAHINLLSGYFWLECGTCAGKTDQSRWLRSPIASKSFWLLLYSGLCHSRPIHFIFKHEYSKKEAINNLMCSRFSVLGPRFNGNHLAIWQAIVEIQHFSIWWIMTF